MGLCHGCQPPHARGRRRSFSPISDIVNSYEEAAWDLRPPGRHGIVVDRFRTAMLFPREHLSGACVTRNLLQAPVCGSDWLPLDIEPALTCFLMMPRCCMDAWSVVMSNQSLSSKPHTHTCTIELSSGTLDRVATVLSTITSSHQLLLAIESAFERLQYCKKYRSRGWRLCGTAYWSWQWKGQDPGQTLHSTAACTRLWGWRCKMWGCRPPEHKRQAEYKSAGLDPKNEKLAVADQQ